MRSKFGKVAREAEAGLAEALPLADAVLLGALGRLRGQGRLNASHATGLALEADRRLAAGHAKH